MEFFYPYYRLTEAGYDVEIFTEKGGKFEGKHGLGLNETKPIGQADIEDYALLYLPGGKAPAELRKNEKVVSFVRAFGATGKPIAAICHGPQLLIAADLVRGREIAAWPEIRDEVEKAGATFIDEALVEDGQFITGRMPGDLPRQPRRHARRAGEARHRQALAEKAPRRLAGSRVPPEKPAASPAAGFSSCARRSEAGFPSTGKGEG
ncbi:MAG: DJ-1/PfpI family protein [Alphaproteobacteria bacterium]